MPWQKLDKTWHDTSVDYCDVCGNLLIKQFWTFSEADESKRVCDERCEHLFYRLRQIDQKYGKG